MISSNHILTTAQCLFEFFTCEIPDFSRNFALAGTMNLTAGIFKYYYEQVEVHKDYDFYLANPNNDIGLITVLMKTDIFKTANYFFKILMDILNYHF